MIKELEQYRIEKSLSKAKMAKLIDVSYIVYCRWTNGICEMSELSYQKVSQNFKKLKKAK